MSPTKHKNIEELKCDLNSAILTLKKLIEEEHYVGKITFQMVQTQWIGLPIKIRTNLRKNYFDSSVNLLNKLLNTTDELFSFDELQNFCASLISDALNNRIDYDFDKLNKILIMQKKKTIYYYFAFKNVVLFNNEQIILSDDIKITTFKDLDLNFDSKEDLRLKYLKDSDVLLEIKVKGGFNSFSQNRAEKIANQVKSLLNFKAGVDKKYIYILRTFIPQSEYSKYKDITVTKNGKLIGFRAKNSSYYQKDCLTLTEKALLPYSDIFFKKKRLNQKEKQISLAIEWLSTALNDVQENKGFLELIIALEAIAETDNKGLVAPSISYQISLICAIVVGTDLEQRESIIDKVKDFYNLRSKIVHGEQVKSVQDNFAEGYKIVSDLIDKYLCSNEYKECNSISQIWKLVKQKMLK